MQTKYQDSLHKNSKFVQFRIKFASGAHDSNFKCIIFTQKSIFKFSFILYLHLFILIPSPRPSHDPELNCYSHLATTMTEEEKHLPNII